MDDAERERFIREQHERERQVLFGNEAFAIGMLQAVSGAAAFGVLSQFQTLKATAGHLSVLIILSAFIVALACATTSAFFKHQYKMWDVKARATDDNKERSKRANKSKRDLWLTRAFMIASAIITVGAFLVLIIAFWIQYFSPDLITSPKPTIS